MVYDGEERGGENCNLTAIRQTHKIKFKRTYSYGLYRIDMMKCILKIYIKSSNIHGSMDSFLVMRF